MVIINILIIAFLACGLIIFTGGAVGLIRFPDCYSRLHPAGKLDTMGLLFSMGALALYTATHPFSMASLLTGLKIIFTVTFVFLTSPTATHAIVDAGFRAGLGPWVKELAPGQNMDAMSRETSEDPSDKTSQLVKADEDSS